MAKPLILISNDDGIESRGIHALVDYLSPYGDIVVAAPEGPQSGKSSAITVDTPLRVKRLPDYNGATMYRINGTPVDCTKLALSTLLPRTPDYVIAGINHGSNAGINAIYSGTMGATFEGCINKICSIGFSLLSHSPEADFSGCKAVIEDVMNAVIAHGLPAGVCLNVNIPKGEVKGIKVTAAAQGRWTAEFDKATDPHGRTIYWLTGQYEPNEPNDSDTDLYWLDRGYATVVPCMPDQTAHSSIAAISEYLKK